MRILVVGTGGATGVRSLLLLASFASGTAGSKEGAGRRPRHDSVGHGSNGHLARSTDWVNSSRVIRRRRDKRRQLDEVLEVLHGIGMMLMDISARLETVVDILKGGDDEGEPDT